MAPPLRIIEVPKGRLVVEAHPRGGRWGAATRDPRGASPHLASARERFLTAEPVTPGVVRRSILASWTRSRNWNVPADHFDLPYDPNPNRDTRLTYGASNVISDLADQLAPARLEFVRRPIVRPSFELCGDGGHDARMIVPEQQ